MVVIKLFTVTSWFIVPFPAFHPKTGLDILQVQPVSKAQARQRTGRAGRETSGVCYRLYTEEQFDELKEMTMPEIQRCNLASVVLQLMALGILDVLHFDFLDSPSQDAIENALEQLVVLGAVRKGNSGFEVKLLWGWFSFIIKSSSYINCFFLNFIVCTGNSQNLIVNLPLWLSHFSL